MSMSTYPCSGYIMPAQDLIDTLPENAKGEAKNYVEDLDWDKLGSLLATHLPAGLPPFDIFMLDDTDSPDSDMSIGTVYVAFNTDDLYELKEREPLIKLRNLTKKTPEHHTWGIWA